ncbi:glycosyl hydrolase 2 galactose-binding domain-containing protein [Streptomyces sp. C8S0]|uniref:glycosyl hydrolase 2 galactose-binding domain-containing protein n=1 Tax=Streptomyces sp. C8S0 TaxID=2585716 RepID=UPI0039AFD03C
MPGKRSRTHEGRHPAARRLEPPARGRHPARPGPGLRAHRPARIRRPPDPFLGLNETETAWVGRRAWTYVTDLHHTGGHERTDLVFEGLDTVAEVVLAGETLGTTRNMHRVHRFDVTGRTGRLEVRFASAYEEADRVRASTGERPNVYRSPSSTSARWPAASAGTGAPPS